MPIKLYDKLEDVPDALRDSAVETKDGKFAAEDRDEIGVLRTTLEKERSRANDAEKAQRTLEAQRSQLQAERDARARGATEDEIEKRRAEIDAAVKPLQEQIAERDAKLRQVLHIDRVRALALSAGILADRIEDAMLILERRTDLTSDGKGLVAKDKDGTVIATRIEDFLARDFKQEKPWLYAGTGTNGSGARANGSPPSAADRKARTEEQVAAEKRAVVSSAI